MSATPRGRPFPDLKPGDHLCCIYQNEQEHRAVLTAYLVQGLERREKVLYIVDAHTAEEILGYLRDAGVGVDAFVASGQLGILHRQDAYLQEGRFDPARMIELLRRETDQAVAEGWAALRATGEMTWALRGEPGAERLIEYEAKLNDFFPGSRCLAICQYDQRRFPPETLLDVLHTHPAVLFGEELVRNFFYLPPEVFLSDRSAGRFVQWANTLLGHQREREERARSEEQFLAFAEVADQVFWIKELDPVRVVYVSPAFERIWGRPVAELTGDPRLWMAAIHPDDRPAVESAYERWLRSEPPADYEVLYRIVRPDGEIRWIADRGCVLAREGARVSRTGGIAEDVTRRVGAEAALRDSETRVRRRLDAILSPAIDLGALELADILDAPRIQRLMDAFYRLTRIGVGVIDLHGNVLVGTGWQEICTRFHRVHPESCKLCVESDREHSRDGMQGSITLYRCPNNLWDMATPIVLGDRHVGNIFLGQFLFDHETPDYDVFREQAHRYGFDEREYLAALDQVPRWSEETVNAAMGFYAELARILGDLSYGHIKLANALENRTRAEATLRRLNRELRAIRSCNQALARAVDERSLLDQVCEIVCDEAGYRLAAVMYAERDAARTVRPAAWAGFDAGYLVSASITWDDTVRGQCPAGTAIRSGATTYVQDFETDPRMAPWRDDVLLRGYRSGIALPLRGETAEVFGAFLVYSSETNAFTPDEVGLMEELAGDLALGIGALRARAERRRTEERFRALFEHSPAGIYRSTAEGRLLEANEAFAQLLGYPSATEVVADGTAGLYLDPRERERFLARIRVDGVVRGLESELRRKDGTPLWVLESASLVPDDTGGLATIEGTLIDISGRKRLEGEMRRLVTAIEQAAEAIVITDTSGTIEYVNPAFTRLTGYGRDEALGGNPRVLKSGKHSARFYRDLWDTLLRGEVWHGHLTNRRKDGTFFEEDATISPVRDESGAIAHYVAVKRDVTQEMALEEQLRQAQKIDAIGRLAGGIAHDFNNLLQAMLSHTQLLRISPAGLERGLAELEAQIQRGASLARQLLLFSRHEPVRRERLELNETITVAASLIRRLVRENVELQLVPCPHSVKVEADRGQLEQVLMNLVVNAVDAMPNGGRLTVRAGATDDLAWFAVEDSGGGIPERVRERVFEPFFTTKAAGHGTGLGLSVVHGIVAQHGGRIELDSTEGVGTTFRVWLPRVASGEHEAVTPPEADDLLPAGRGERLLVVEDEAAAREALREIAASLGYRVVAVGSGSEAGRLPADPPFDALLTDLMLPDVNGADLACSLQERWPGLKVVLMSGYSEEDWAKHMSRVRGAEFLQKPFGTRALARALSHVLATL